MQRINFIKVVLLNVSCSMIVWQFATQLGLDLFYFYCLTKLFQFLFFVKMRKSVHVNKPNGPDWMIFITWSWNLSFFIMFIVQTMPIGCYLNCKYFWILNWETKRYIILLWYAIKCRKKNIRSLLIRCLICRPHWGKVSCVSSGWEPCW